MVWCSCCASVLISGLRSPLPARWMDSGFGSDCVVRSATLGRVNRVCRFGVLVHLPGALMSRRRFPVPWRSSQRDCES